MVDRSVLEQHSGLGPVSASRPLGTAGRAWRIDTPDGRFVLRRFSSTVSPDQAAFSAVVQQHVARAGGPATAVVPDDEGRLVTPCADGLFMVAVYAEGACPDAFPPAGRCHELGRALGRVHRTLRSRPDLVEQAPNRAAGGRDPSAPILRAMAVHCPHCPHPVVRQVLAGKLARAAALPAETLALAARLPASVIHGDFHLGNVVLGPHGDVQAVLDFDLARAVPPGYEVVRSLVYCVGPAGGHERFAPRVQAFLAGYLSGSPLGDDELSTMVELYRALQVSDVHGLDVCQGADPDTVSFGIARFAILSWLDRYGTLLTGLARSVRSSLDS